MFDVFYPKTLDSNKSKHLYVHISMFIIDSLIDQIGLWCFEALCCLKESLVLQKRVVRKNICISTFLVFKMYNCASSTDFLTCIVNQFKSDDLYVISFKNTCVPHQIHSWPELLPQDWHSIYTMQHCIKKTNATVSRSGINFCA